MKKLRYFIETKAVKLLAWWMQHLPRHVILVLAKIVGFIAYLADSRGRDTALENLRVAFGGSLTWTERHRITWRSYQNFARTFFDLFWFSTLTRETWREWFEVEIDPEADLEAVRHTGGLWFSPHYGSFEMMGLVPSFMGFPYVVIAQNFKNPTLTEVFAKARSVSGNTLVPQQAAALRLARTLGKHGHAGLLIDLSMKPEKGTGIIECFGLKASVPLLHVSLAQRFGVPLVPMWTEPLEDGRFHTRFLAPIWTKPDDEPTAVAQRCWDVGEREIRDHPERWLWMYKQWRYLPGDDSDASYPDYANHHKAFAKMVADQKFRDAT